MAAIYARLDEIDAHTAEARARAILAGVIQIYFIFNATMFIYMIIIMFYFSLDLMKKCKILQQNRFQVVGK